MPVPSSSNGIQASQDLSVVLWEFSAEVTSGGGQLTFSKILVLPLIRTRRPPIWHFDRSEPNMTWRTVLGRNKNPYYGNDQSRAKAPTILLPTPSKRLPFVSAFGGHIHQ